jgi:hypothetical protein
MPASGDLTSMRVNTFLAGSICSLNSWIFFCVSRRSLATSFWSSF